MKELKEYTLSIWSILCAMAFSIAVIALATGYFALCWWVIRFIWNYFLEI